MIKDTPIIAFVYLPTVLYEEVFEPTANPPHLAMPLGLMYLSSALKQRLSNSQVFLVDYSVAADKLHQEVLKGVRDLSGYRRDPSRFIVETAQAAARGRVPDIIAVSLTFSTSRPIALQVAERLSRLWPGAVVVFGGNHATNDVPFLLRHQDIDFVCRGEAEWAFVEFVKALAQSDEPAVKGFYSKRYIAKSRPIYINCDYPSDLDELPFPDWGLIDLKSYMEANLNRRRDFVKDGGTGIFPMMTTRGCPFQCTFCASHTVHGHKICFRSVENVVAEIYEIYSRFGITIFTPEDDLFIADKKRTLDLLARIRNLGIPNLTMFFPSALAINTLDEEIIDALCATGMGYLFLAVESGSPYTQKQLIKKGVDLNRARRLVKYANERKLYTRVNFIIGFPHEKMEHIQETIDFIKTLGADWNAIAAATPLLGSEMFDEFCKMGVLDFEARNWERTYFVREFDTEEFKAEDLANIIYRVNLEVNFINNRQMRLGDWELAIKVFTDVVKRHPFHIIAYYQIMLCLEKLGRHEDADRYLQHIQHLISTAPAATEMLRKYGDMFPDLVDRLHHVKV
jgi:radical SAM superfamily enzyme YgiQ (UPF0313 family)